MARLALLILPFLVACEPVPSNRADSLLPSLDPSSAPAPTTADATAPAVDAPATDASEVPDAEPDADAEAVADDEPELTDAQLLAAAQGLEMPEPEPEPEPGEVLAEPYLEPGLVAPSLREAARGWGVRLVSTIPYSQPPRAVLALSSGDEIVVEPGTFVDEERLLVMAVGTDGVQIAHVLPAGDHVRIQTETLAPLYRARPSAPSPDAGSPLVPVP